MRRPLRSDEARAVANLAIDLGDPGRMAKARRIHRGNNVGTVDIGPGIAETTVTDPSGDLYDVAITVDAAAPAGEAPSAEDVTPNCACEDGSDICTHGLAAILGIAEEIEANGRLLAVWSGGAVEESAPTEAASSVGTEPDSVEAASDFLAGSWSKAPTIPPMTPLQIDNEPSLIVDEVDAGPVVVDARSAIKRGLSRYRARA